MDQELLITMAINEVSHQCRYAEIAYANIDRKAVAGIDVAFSSIHSFLSHCANVSKFLWSRDLAAALGRPLAEVLGIPDASPIKEKRFRNILEHYDEYLVEWMSTRRPGIILDNCIGPKNSILGSSDGSPVNSTFVRHYDPDTNTFTLLDSDLDLSAIFTEVVKIKESADSWTARARFSPESRRG